MGVEPDWRLDTDATHRLYAEIKRSRISPSTIVGNEGNTFAGQALRHRAVVPSCRQRQGAIDEGKDDFFWQSVEFKKVLAGFHALSRLKGGRYIQTRNLKIPGAPFGAPDDDARRWMPD